MDLSLISAAAEAVEHERSEVPFFICGGSLAAYAVLISVFGFRKPDFPATAVAARGVMMVGALLVAAAISTAIYVAL
jgi:uncharacterized membrane protein (DUF485 family)